MHQFSKGLFCNWWLATGCWRLAVSGWRLAASKILIKDTNLIVFGIFGNVTENKNVFGNVSDDIL